MGSLSLTLILIIITCLISFMAWNNQALMAKLMMNPYITRKNQEYTRFVTSGFIHADYWHLGFNMLSLYFFGGSVETALGGTHFVILYLLAIIISDIPTYLKYRNHSGYNSLGASGGVSAIIFASIILYPLQELYIYMIPVPAIVYGALFVLYSYYMDRRNTDNTNHSAHLYGALVGVIYVAIYKPELIMGYIQAFINR